MYRIPVFSTLRDFTGEHVSLGRYNFFQFAELALMAHAHPSGPFLVVHGIEGQNHPHILSFFVKLHQGLDIIWLDAGNEVGQVLISEPSGLWCTSIWSCALIENDRRRSVECFLKTAQ